MSWEWIFVSLILCGVLNAVARGGAAGWPGVFPEMSGYQRTFTSPIVDPDKTKNTYRQTVKYEWTGGAIKLLEVTLARDPAFAKKYSAETLKKEAPPPQALMVGKQSAWLWKVDKLDMKEIWPLYARLVIPMAKDRVLILDAKGAGPWGDVADLVRHFDLAKLERALDSAPK